MAITKPPVLPSWAEAGDKVQPSNAEIQAGWPLSSIPPSRQRFNWLLNFLANGIRYFSRRGLPDYDAAETYMTGDRIIGDDGKTYRSLIDNNTAQTPSTSPTKWERWALTLAEMYTSLTTQAQFDNSVKPATTAFVQKALGNFSTINALTGATTLDTAYAGSCILLQGASQFTTTLFSGVTVPRGSAITVFNLSSAPQTITGSAANTLVINGGAAITSMTIQPGDSITIIASGWANLWYATGTGDLQYSASFGSALTSSGYQKLPSGLIIQWGALGDSSWVASTFRTISYPVAFPNGVLQHSAVLSNSAGSLGRVNTNQLSASQLQLMVDYSGAATVRWVAIGY